MFHTHQAILVHRVGTEQGGKGTDLKVLRFKVTSCFEGSDPALVSHSCKAIWSPCTSLQLLLVRSMAAAPHCIRELFGKRDLMIVLGCICRGKIGRGNVIIGVWPGYRDETPALVP